MAMPGLACAIMVLWLWMTLWNRDGIIPFFDVGIFCAMATLLYTVYPLFNYWHDGLEFGRFSDFRLKSYNITPVELGVFHLRHVLYLFAFVVSYSVFRGGGTIEAGNVNTPSSSSRKIILYYFLLLTGYFYLLQLVTGFSFNPGYIGDAYTRSVVGSENMPLILRQTSTRLWGIMFVFKIALVSVVVSQCSQNKWRIILILWVTAETINAVVIKGARTDFILFLMGIALLYHRMIKPFTTKLIITMGVIGLTLFIFMGIYRSYFDVGDMQAEIALHGTSVYAGSNEFQGLLGTAYDVCQRVEKGIYLPWYLYINDFIWMLPPQQIMPFEKIAASEWYLEQIGLSGTGIGCMWGVISQCFVGLGWLELALRGAILGYILARFHRWYLQHQSGFLETFIYVFFCLRIYYSFRDTTFSPLASFFWNIIPAYILLRIGIVALFREPGYTESPCVPLNNTK